MQFKFIQHDLMKCRPITGSHVDYRFGQ